jgi:two-component system phosphate regulon sensor histidine kinase PhoR
MSYRWRLLLSFLSFTILSLSLFYFGSNHWLEKLLLDLINRDLEDQVKVLAPLIDVEDPDLDCLIDRIASPTSLRITVIDASGRVLADSAFSDEALRGLDNHANRPEVIQAGKEGIGLSLRYSTSADVYFHYVAVPLSDRRGTLRIAKPAADVREVTWDLQRIMGSVAFLLLLVGVLASWLFSQRLSGSIRKLFDASRKIVDGETVREIPLSSGDELGELARQLERMSIRVGEQLEMLSSERNHLTTILNSMTEGVLVTDGRGRIAVINPALQEILGLGGQLLGKTPLEVVRNLEVSEGVEQTLKLGRTQETEFRIRDRELLARFAPIGSPGKVVGVVIVFHDITELRRLENRQKEFVSNVSHELKTPLTSIQGYAETLMEEELLEPMHRSFAEKIFRNSGRLSEMIEELFNLARLESGQPRFSWEPVNFRRLMEELGADFSEQLDARELEFAYQNHCQQETFMAGARYIERVFRNLIENAIKYTEKGAVRVFMDTVDGEVRFSVEDTGIGIPQEELERIFERFYRVDKDRSRRSGGSGIGLAIVKHIVQLHGGRVWAESDLGHGSTFYFAIPFRKVV